MTRAMVSVTLLRTPWLLQERQNPLCTMGRVPMHLRPRLGGWSARQVCGAGMRQQLQLVVYRSLFHMQGIQCSKLLQLQLAELCRCTISAH